MKRMSAYELERRSEKELCVLFQTVSQNLIRTKRGTRRPTCPLTTDEAAPAKPGTASFRPSPGI